MDSKIKMKFVDMKRVFNVENEPMPRGAWWWWFWLFFFNNPKNSEKPRQLMILWSTKNVKEIFCNDVKLNLNHSKDRTNLPGAVAAWYFDGEKMHHNFLLDQCNIKILNNGLISNSKIPTSFFIDNKKSTIKIGDDFKFVAKTLNNRIFMKPNHSSKKFVGKLGYSIIRLNQLNLSGKVENKVIRGSAYFQRVFVNAPSAPWNWGIFHFKNGSNLTYFKIHFLGKALKKDIMFFDSKKIHSFKDLDVKLLEGRTPAFEVSGKNEHEKINFIVKTYSQSSWTFRKKSLGLVTNKLVYNEYPAFISEFDFRNKKTGEKITLSDLGESVGNAEHTTGFLF